VPKLQPAARPLVARSEAPYVTIKVKPGWHYAPSRNAFVSVDSRAVCPSRGPLPWTKVEPTAASLASLAEETLSEAERELARYYVVVVPREVDLKRLLARVRKWPCVETAELPPGIGLP